MARGKGSTASLKHSDAIELFKRIDIVQLRDFLGTVFPRTKIRQINGAQLRMNCLTPGHPDEHPSFIVDVRKGRAYCEVCKYVTRNLLQLLQDCRGWSFPQSLQQIQALTGIRVVSAKLEALYEELDLHREALRVVAWSANRYLIQMMAPDGGDAAYDPIAQHNARGAVDWLFTKRKHDPDLAAMLPYGVWPPLHQLLVMVDKRLTDVADADYRQNGDTRLGPERRAKILERVKKLTEGVGVEWANGVVFVTGHDFSTPGRIRIRRPDPDNDDSKIDNFHILPGITADEPNGHFGLYAPHLAAMTKVEAASLRLLVVEGENDCITVAEALLREGIGGWLCVASCGSGTGTMAVATDELLDAGFETVYLLGDHPDPEHGKGEGWVRSRLTSAKRVDAKVFVRWHELRAQNGFVKDPDDVIHRLGFEHFQRVVLRDPEKSFVACDEWAIGRAIEDGRDLEDTRERTALVARYGECLAHPAQLSNYLEKVCAKLDLQPGIVRGQIVRGQDDEGGFVGRLSATFEHDLHFLYKEDTSKGSVVHAYHRDTQRPVRLPVDDGPGIMSAYSNLVGDVQEYYKTNVGMPQWLFDERAADAGASVMRELHKPLSDYTRLAFQRNFQGLPNRNECLTVGLGPHVVECQDAEYGVQQYLNTGNRVFRARYVGEDKLAWEPLAGPSDGRQLFTMVGQPYGGMAKTVEDLEWGNDVTLDQLRDVFRDLVRIYEQWGWKRKTEAILLATLVFHLAMPHFSDDKLILGIMGPTTSGKSALMASICGGQYPKLQIIDSALYQSNYSIASIYTGFNGSSCTIALEEFATEAAGSMKTRQVDDIMELIRQVNTPGGAQVSRVGHGGMDVKTVRTNVITTSLNPPKDIQDANRRLEIETDKRVGHADPGVELIRLLGVDRFLQIRRMLNLGLFKYYRKYMELSGPIARTLTTERITPFKVEVRFMRNFIGPATMMALLGMDWKPFVIKCVEERKETLDAYANATPTNTLFDTVLRTTGIRVGQNYTSVMGLLAEPDKWPILNSSTCGVLYNNEQGYLVIEWIPIRSNGGVLHRCEPWSSEPHHRLKYQMDQHPLAVPQSQIPTLGVAEFLSAYGIAAQLHNLSVLKIGPLINDMRALNKQRTSRGPASQGQNQEAAPPVAVNLGLAPSPNAHLPPGMRPRGNNL